MKKAGENTQPLKKWFLVSVFAMVVLATGISLYTLVAVKRNKIACIDTAKVLKAYKGIEELSKTLEEKNKLFKSRLDTLASEFQGALKEYEKRRSKLNTKEMQEEENQLRKKQQEYAQYNSSNQDGLKQEEMKILEKAVERVNDKIARYAKSEGYSAVFGASPNGAVLYVGDYVDITNEVVEIIND